MPLLAFANGCLGAQTLGIDDGRQARSCFLGLFALRDVDVDAGHSARRAVGVALDDLPAPQEPLPPALLRPAAILRFVCRRVTGDVLVDRAADRWHVIGVDALIPGAASSLPFHLTRFVTEHPLGRRAEVDVSAVDTPVPQPFVRAFECEAKALLALEERVFRDFPGGGVVIDRDQAPGSPKLVGLGDECCLQRARSAIERDEANLTFPAAVI